MITRKHVSRLWGYTPALPTPFDQDGNVDGAGFDLLCERQIREAPLPWRCAARPTKPRPRAAQSAADGQDARARQVCDGLFCCVSRSHGIWRTSWRC
jgi:hypothetical protein